MKAPTTDRNGGGPGTGARGPLVGRREELGELSSALAGAREGRGALFLIAGEAGIGKTRLAEAIVEEAAAQGDTVLWGSAWESGGAPPYWPWIQAIRGLVQERPAGEVAEDLGTGAPYVAQIAPELGERLSTTANAAPSLDSEATRFTAFDATASFIRASAARRPTVIVLDDLHAADIATVRLLEFLARSLHGARILAIGTYRAGEASRDSEITAALADLARAGRPLLLGGLSRNEVLELATAHSPHAPPDRLGERLHALTEGNPLFVDEVMRLLLAEGALSALPSGRLPVPDGVRETIRRRLEPLPQEAVDVLTAASVIGPEFAVETLARVVPEERLLQHLDAAREAGLVEERAGEIGRYRFSHALIRETLYDDLPAHERVALHVAVGETLVELYGDRTDIPHSELAHHFLQAAPTVDPVRAAVYAVRAGEYALESMAYEQAIELFGDALRVLDLAGDDAGRRAPILLAMGQAEMRAGRLDAGRRTLRAAADAARSAGDAELLAHAALASAPWGLATALTDEEGLIPLLEEALDRLPEADGALRARLLARLAAALYWSAAPDRREALAEEAIAMARRVGDPATLAFVLSDAHLATWDPDSPERALPWASEIYALAERVGNVELAMAAHSWRISLLLERGEMAVADHEIETFREAATRLHQQRGQAQSLLHRCARGLIAGDFADAERILGEAAEYAGLLQQDQILAMRLAALAFVMREEQGRLGELEGAVRQFGDAQPEMPVWRCALLCVYLQTGREAELRREYERFAAEGFGALGRDNLWLPALSFLAQACAHLGDPEGAAELRALLTPYSGRNVVTPDVAYIGPVDRYLALMAAAEGDLDGAVAWFASARELAQAMGAKPTLARLALEEAEAVAGSDPARAAALAAEALAGAEALGLEGIAERARPLAGAQEAAASGSEEPAPGVPHSLRRRGDVWEVAGGGREFHLKDAKGVRHLALLLSYPGREFHALELVGGTASDAPTAGGVTGELAIRARGEDDAGPLLDAHAKAEYRQRVSDLQEELEEAESFNDPERASRARAELDFISSELSAAVGLGGRDRRAAASAERARVNVTRALRGTVDRIAEYDPELGHHLSTCIRTGTFCVYDPGPGGYPWEIDPTS
jgi:AAA ATPase domain